MRFRYSPEGVAGRHHPASTGITFWVILGVSVAVMRLLCQPP